jgi:pimeloyl-ACP methyl ester carboxylesterase
LVLFFKKEQSSFRMILAVERQGPTGTTPLILLHGLFGRGRNLAAIARGLAATRQVILLDLRNHGASPHAPGMAYPVLAGDVLETLDGLGLARFSLLGHSMGGKTAMACALLAPDRVDRLLVADIAPVSYAHHNRAVAAAMQAIPLHPGLTRQAASALLQDAVPDETVRNFLLQNLLPGAAPSWRIGLDEIAAALADIEAWPDGPPGRRFDRPALFVTGAQSDYVTEDGRNAARALFPRAHFVTLNNAGHWLHADQPALFLETAQRFFADAAAL